MCTVAFWPILIAIGHAHRYSKSVLKGKTMKCHVASCNTVVNRSPIDHSHKYSVIVCGIS